MLEERETLHYSKEKKSIRHSSSFLCVGISIRELKVSHEVKLP